MTVEKEDEARGHVSEKIQTIRFYEFWEIRQKFYLELFRDEENSSISITSILFAKLRDKNPMDYEAGR